MTTRQFVTKSGDTWEWEETPETIEALKKLNETERRNRFSELELKAPDYGVGK
jgi:hypothetical protein